MPAPKKDPRKRPTIYDLARHAGVSPGTASRVLNNRDRVDPDTRARVLSSARVLNLKPRAGARMQQIAVLSDPRFPDRIEGYAARLSAHLSFSLSRRNATVLNPSDPISQLPDTFLDGIIAVTYDQDLVQFLTELEERIPVVYMDKFDCRPGQHAVCSDHRMAGYLAARHFLARGKKRLAIVGMDILPMHERLKGYREAIEEAGATADEKLLQLFGRETGTTNYASSITHKVRAGADAIFTPGSSYEGINCLHVLSYVMGLAIPRDVALITGEIGGISDVMNPPLTTIEEPLPEMAEQAVTMIMRLASGEKIARRQLTLPVRLIERASVF
ncbi:MAG TPA: LacI family DNA-binding transcriptional regulator [Opitutaceae bacterium]|nr:LacI family DNA-binding transcriptional regulator [Opitutaceae bacterium]